MKKRNKIIFIMIIGLVTCISMSFILLTAITEDAVLIEGKLNLEGENLQIFDSENNKLALKAKNIVKLENVSNSIIDAFVVLEDKRFFEHNGIDYKRIVGATVKNIKTFKFTEGASTISQQLIKNTHLTNEKTIKRKLKEAKLAILLEKQYTKSQILEMYLNILYFGTGIYGIDNACKVYFDKSPSEVTISESAMLAGVVKNPKNNSPIINFEGAIKRRNVVLDVMFKNNVIDEGTLIKAKYENIVIKNKAIENNYNQSYITNAMFEASQILNLKEEDLINSGYKIITYLNQEKQSSSYKYMKSSNLNPSKAEGSALTINNSTLGITSYFNSLNVPDCYIKRNGGSALKPFTVYGLAIDNFNYSPANQLIDEPININGYSPKNYNDVYHGYVSLRDALKNSLNVPAVKILDEIGIDNSIKFCKKFGFDFSGLEGNLSLALGSADVSPVDLASAYTGIANYGNFGKASFVKEIYDKNDNLLFRKSGIKPRAISESSAYILTNILQDTVKSGTGSKLKNLDMDIACKTGTVAFKNSKLNTDAWCVSYTSEDTFLVWQGCLNNNSLLPSNVTGGSYSAMINARIVKDYYADAKPRNFEKPESVKQIVIDKDELNLNHVIVKANFKSKNTLTDYFTEFNLPMENEVFTIEDIKVENVDGLVEIKFFGKENLSFKVYKKHGFFGYYELDDISFLNNTYKIKDNKPSKYFKNIYKIVCNGKEFDVII